MSSWFVPVAISAIFLIGICRGVDVFDCFVKGAKEGIKTSLSILPVLIGLLTIVGMLTASGAIDWLCSLLAPITGQIGMPGELIPIALLRPLSGSGALSLLEQLFETVSPDSTTGLMASVLVASSETTFYTLAVYFGAVGISKTRYALASALIGDAVGMVVSVWSVRLLCG